jgi:hypothetical protein
MQSPSLLAHSQGKRSNFRARLTALCGPLRLLAVLASACANDARDVGPITGGPSAVDAGPALVPGDAGLVTDATNVNPPLVDSAVAGPDASGPEASVAPSDASRSDTGPSPIGEAGPAEDAGGGGVLTGPFPAVTDFAKNGPYTSTTLKNTGPNGSYTVYLPTMLAPNGAKNPIVGWMSGGGTTHDLYPLLPRLATHGFVVVAANVVPGIGEEANLGKQIIAGIDWALAENEKSGSMLFGKLDSTKIASMGYSMGSLSTFMIASDPRLTTTVHISGGNMAPDRIGNLRAPAAFICGTPAASCGILDGNCDIAAANCDTDFNGAKTPVFYANFAGGHLGILLAPLQDQIGALATMWLRWKLMSDRSLDVKFLGDACEVCQDKSWSKVQRKNL